MDAEGKPVLVNTSGRDFEQFFPAALRAGYPEIRLIHVSPAGGPGAVVAAAARHGARVLMTGWGSPPLPETFRRDCPSVEYVCHLTGELRALVPRALIERGLLVTNWGDAVARYAAEAALMLVLACLRRLGECQAAMRERRSLPADLPEAASLFGKRVGIHGFGSIARSLVPLLGPFGCAVRAYSAPVPEAVFREAGVARETDLVRLFAESDVVVEVEALTPQTRGTVTWEHLSALKPGSALVNCGRGAVLEEAALLRAARRPDLAIGLDVFHAEPLPADSPLRDLPNVILMPHRAIRVRELYPAAARTALENVRAWLSGRPVRHRIGPAEYDRMT